MINRKVGIDPQKAKLDAEKAKFLSQRTQERLASQRKYEAERAVEDAAAKKQNEERLRQAMSEGKQIVKVGDTQKSAPTPAVQTSMRPPARVVPPEVSAQRQQDAAKRVAEITQARPSVQEASQQFRQMSNALPTRSQMAEMTQGRPVPEVARPQVATPAMPAQAPQPFGSTMGGQPMGGGLAGMKKGGMVKKAKGGSVSSASKRADGCAVRGKTKGKML